MKNLKGKTAFITGGSTGIGIGFGMATVFARAGMNVAITDIRDYSSIQRKSAQRCGYHDFSHGRASRNGWLSSHECNID